MMLRMAEFLRGLWAYDDVGRKFFFQISIYVSELQNKTLLIQ